jgi:hypothetical protein
MTIMVHSPRNVVSSRRTDLARAEIVAVEKAAGTGARTQDHKEDRRYRRGKELVGSKARV